MPRTSRQFCASISVRFDTRRTKIELSPALLHGGPKGLYRVRVNRKWIDAPTDADGGPLFFSQTGLAQLAAHLAFGGEAEPASLPDIPRGSRVRVSIEREGEILREQGFTLAPPIFGFDGRVYVAVSTYSFGATMCCIDDLILRGNA